MGFDMHEVDRLAADLAAAPATVSLAAAREVSSATSLAARTAQGLAPVLTGELKASIQGSAHGLSGTVTASARYAGYVEYGTSDTAPQPYMRPAAERATGPLADGLVDAGADIL